MPRTNTDPERLESEQPEDPAGGEDTIPEEFRGDRAPPDPDPLPPVGVKLTLPAPGLYGTHNEQRRFGITETIAALQEVGVIWERRYPGSPIGIGDISQEGGGEISGHASHRKGVDFDVRPQRSDGDKKPVTYHDSPYSRDKTQELIDLMCANSALAVRMIFFNDPEARGVQEWPNHDNHLHVRFHFPGIGAAPPGLERGSKGPAVRDLQRTLNRWLLKHSSQLPLLKVDGHFGPKTEAAVREFQAASQCEPSGVVDTATWSALRTACDT